MDRQEITKPHRAAYEKNRKKILATQSICGICGGIVDKKLKPPHPLAPVLDHIMPVAKGGHPSDINNMQLAHASCNRQKSDKLFIDEKKVIPNNRNLPLSMNWKGYRSE